ncbi:MAG: Na+/H+ antiporter NhaA [Chloroflexi bacterium]|nr:Na+/H+ antiporter NhaA [Chloroflexota bacterium]
MVRELTVPPFSADYDALWGHVVSFDLGFVELTEDVKHWVNDGLMTLFFFLVTLEVKRELLHGELASLRTAALPLAAALGGIVGPAAIYLALNASGEASGWGIPVATDIAFALAALALLSRNAPAALVTFMLTLAVVDDIVAIGIIAVFYTETIDLAPLSLAALFVGTMFAAQRAGVTGFLVYWLIGLLAWIAMHESGVHATLIGVLTAAITPSVARVSIDRLSSEAPALLEQAAGTDHDEAEAALGQLETLVADTEAPLERLERTVHPISGFLVLPLFALANAGVSLSPDALAEAIESRVTLGVYLGLVVGAPVGVLGASWLAVKSGLATLPAGVSWRQIAGVGALAGIGFSVSIFITDLAFGDSPEAQQAKIGVTAAALTAAFLGWLLLRGGAASTAGAGE